MKKINQIGIIGGTGKVGQWFKLFFEQAGYSVVVAGRSTTLSIEDCAKESDVVLVCVPIAETVDLLKRIAPLVAEDGLLMDVTSLKEAPMKAMLAYGTCAVIGMHPVFGPSVADVKNQTVVLCDGREKGYLSWISKLLTDRGGIVKVMDAISHDKAMAVVQGLQHFSSISICHALSKVGTSMKEMERVSSPIFRFNMDIAGRILNQDPELYADVELLNEHVTPILKAYIADATHLLSLIEAGDREGFVDYFNEAADYLGVFKDEAEDYTNKIISYLVKEGKRKK
ncbi:MAG: prephenate dehydrogenase/arogenate dehydrogenase family protein [Nanoarchaeota archaeon]|nr:prephenate dehydrogenase/arogenate dehydrogenase family protein [Nanoarchaeota archaeon]